MTDVLERISDVLRAHRPKDVADDKTRPGFRIWRNGCTGCDFVAEKDEAIDHCDHLSAVLLSTADIAIVDAETLRIALNFGYGKEPTPAGAIARANLREQVAAVQAQEEK